MRPVIERKGAFDLRAVEVSALAREVGQGWHVPFEAGELTVRGAAAWVTVPHAWLKRAVPRGTTPGGPPVLRWTCQGQRQRSAQPVAGD
ncbi:hypothetical protein [Streptomyces blastmyceticus]|uniref:Uncharacterized protein n=1 Tax=Streptomyces blastmyceticus TaxID=68180 RepID=A0ABN0XXI9_9ACTN